MLRTNKDELTIEDLESLIAQHAEDVKRYNTLQRYYEGRHDIMEEARDPERITDFRIVNPFPKYITDIHTGFLVGNPIVYSAIDPDSTDDEDFLEELLKIFRYNDEQDENAELAKSCSIKGCAYELLWIDSDSNIRFKMIPAEEIFLVYDQTLDDNIVAGIRYFTQNVNGKDVNHVEVYYRDKIAYYSTALSGRLILDREEEHFFNDVPIVRYENNREGLGDFEQVLTQIDAYDRSQSNTLNDLAQFTEAFLVLINLSGTDDDDLRKAKRDRVLKMEDDGRAEWLTKDINDTHVENFKTRLRQDIHKFSFTPDLTDESFGGTVSGVSLRYKLLGMEQLRSNKERKFKVGLMRRIELISNILKISNRDILYTGISITFEDSLPQNLLELSDVINNLSSYLSTETVLSNIPFIENPIDEMNRLESERERNAPDFEALRAMMTPLEDDEEEEGNGEEE